MADEGKYEGEWNKGEKNGFGVYEYKNKDKYQGLWKNGLRNG